MLLTKIVCTLGPASGGAEGVSALVAGGMNVARINMSHGTAEEHRAMIRRVRAASEAAGRPVGVLVDLAGPKVRVGALDEDRFLGVGDTIRFAPEDEATGDDIPMTLTTLADEVAEGDRLLLDDGLIELVCLGTDGHRSDFEVVRSGLLKAHKGMNLPALELSVPSLTKKDEQDLSVALEEGVEYVGLSFVRRASDVLDLKSRVGDEALIVAKIEKAQAVAALEDILRIADAVMVARGDLGVELPFEQVPMAQKRIVQMANFHGRPVITATQMLESMIESPRPTRAEVSDVANAILDGTDAVMLSGETAVGRYPERALEAIVRIAREIEDSGVLEEGPRYASLRPLRTRRGATAREHAVASATVEAVREVEAPAILVFTRSGFTARLVASYRAPVPIFGVCTDPSIYRALSAVWGVIPVLAAGSEATYEGLSAIGSRAVLESGVGRPGQFVVVTAGFPFHRSGSTNTLRIEQL